jgi:integrase
MLCAILRSIALLELRLSALRPISHLLFNELINTYFSRLVCAGCVSLFASQEEISMARKVGQIIARGDRRWLIRVYLGRDLRHSAATIALAAGVSPKVVSEQLGHASAAFTLDTHAHVLPHMHYEAAARVEAALIGGVIKN